MKTHEEEIGEVWLVGENELDFIGTRAPGMHAGKWVYKESNCDVRGRGYTLCIEGLV